MAEQELLPDDKKEEVYIVDKIGDRIKYLGEEQIEAQADIDHAKKLIKEMNERIKELKKEEDYLKDLLKRM